MALAHRVQARNARLAVADVVGHQESPAGVHGCGGDQLTTLNETELGGAAADVDVEDAAARVKRAPCRARAVHRQHRLHVVAGGGADEFTALLGQHGRDGLAVFAAQGFTGQDHGAGVNLVGMQSTGFIGTLDDLRQCGRVDVGGAQVGR